jgi:type I restriction enzyme S subunit
LNVGDMLQFVIPLPPIKAEQEAIAEALSAADALIESLEKLLAKKRQLKQGAMQELLSGKRRKPRFGGEWEQMRLGDLFSFKNGLNKAKRFFGYGIPIVNYMDVFRDPRIYCARLEGRVSLTAHEVKSYDVRKGDVLFTRTSETPDEIGLASVVLDEPGQTVFSGFVLRARPKGARLDDRFQAYCLRAEYVRAQIVSKASYTTRALTNGRLLSAVVLLVPDIREQAAIADILTDVDAEIAALEAKLAKARQIKQGMMQELLTGRIRLI